MKTSLPIVLVFLASLVPSLRAQSPPVVNVFSSVPYLTEGSSFYFIFRKEGRGTIRVPFSFDGTAVQGTNYSIESTTFSGNSVLMPDNLSELYLFVRTYRDSSTNTDVTLFLQLQPDPSYQIGIGSSAGTRILQYFSSNTQNLPPLVSLSANQWADRVDFTLSASDYDGIAEIWLIDNTNILSSFLPAGARAFSTSFSWTNPPAGRHEISTISLDTRGNAAAGFSNSPPLVIIVGDQFTFPEQGVASTNGVTLTADLITSFDTPERHRRLLLEFAIPASATNSEGYLRFGTFHYSSQRFTNEIFAYNGDGLVSTNDLYVSGEPVLQFSAPPGSAVFQFDVTDVIRNHAGGYLGLWINDLPNPARTTEFGYPATRFSDIKLEILPDSNATDEPTVGTWLNPPIPRRIPFFNPSTFAFQVVDNDSRVTAVELRSVESGLIARTEGIMFLGTNIVSLVWTNPIPGNHTLFLKTFNEDNAPAIVDLGQLEVENLNATVTIPPPPSPPPPANPFLVKALVTTPTGGTFQAQLSLLSTGEVLERKQINTVAGTNEITLSWTNATPGTNIFVVRLSDDRGNSSSAVSPMFLVPEVEHEWLYSGDYIQCMDVVDAAGRARVWGFGYDGDLGLGFRLDPPYFLSNPTALPSVGLQWKQIASTAPMMPGVQSHFGLTSDGSLYGWGYNDAGSLGFVTGAHHVIVPTKVPFPTGVSWWRKVVCGRYFVAAIDQDQNLWTWGPSQVPAKTAARCVDLRHRDESRYVALFSDGTLTGLSSRTPLAPGVKPTRQFAASATHYLAIGDDGQLYAWGSNLNGELPFPSPISITFTQPTNGVHIAGVQSWTRVAATANLSLAVDNNGRLFAWGSSTNSGVRNPVRNEPGLVDIPETGFVDIAVTPAFAMAVTQRGNVYFWGSIFAADTSSRRRTIRFPELVQGLPDLLEPQSAAILTTFDSAIKLSNNSLTLNLVAPLSTPLELQTSSDLQTWRTLTNFMTNTNRVRFVQPLQTESNLFFRVH